jgi:hypothetical protein
MANVPLHLGFQTVPGLSYQLLTTSQKVKSYFTTGGLSNYGRRSPEPRTRHGLFLYQLSLRGETEENGDNFRVSSQQCERATTGALRGQ